LSEIVDQAVKRGTVLSSWFSVLGSRFLVLGSRLLGFD
jgi:hypothetical protein